MMLLASDFIPPAVPGRSFGCSFEFLDGANWFLFYYGAYRALSIVDSMWSTTQYVVQHSTSRVPQKSIADKNGSCRKRRSRNPMEFYSRASIRRLSEPILNQIVKNKETDTFDE